MKNTYVLVGVIVLVGIIAGYGWDTINNDVTTSIESEESGRDFVIVPFGSEGQLATIIMTIHGFEATKTLSDVFGKTHAQENTKFILVDASFTNITNKSLTLYPNGMLLTDSDGRKYDIFQATSGGAIGVESSAIDGRDLGPDILERGMLVYAVPADFEPYAIEIEKQDSTTEMKTLVLLLE